MTENDIAAHASTRDTPAEGGLRGFMNRGGARRFVAFLVVYLAVYLGAGRLGGMIGGHFATDDVLTSVGSVFVQVTFPLVVGAIVLVALSRYLGWTGELYGRQPVYRSWWMWIAPVVVLVPVVLRVFGIDWGGIGTDVVVFMLLTGLLIGFVEELTYRGLAVKMLRDGGHGEWVVAALSSVFFALSHSANLLSGQSITVVGPTVVYTLGFGVLMYLSMRAIGYLAGAMILHGLTDPTTVLATGGIDKVGDGGTTNDVLSAAGLVAFPLVIIGLVLLIFIRGRAPGRAQSSRQPSPRG